MALSAHRQDLETDVSKVGLGDAILADQLTRQVEQSLRRQHLLAPGDNILVALSGGADSVCLTLTLAALADRWRFGLHAFHLNHLLRGREADLDEHFVRGFCANLGLPLTVRRVEVREYARLNKLSLEEASRIIRYNQLLLCAQTLGCAKIATAHTADDNAETVLLNLVRGTGLHGLGGIPSSRQLLDATCCQSGRSKSTVTVVRPLLTIERTAIEDFLSRHRVSHCLDRSNLALEFRRNIVRHKVMPLLKQLNPNIVSTLARTARILRDEDELLEQAVRQAQSQLLKADKTETVIDRTRLASEPSAIQRRLLHHLLPELDALQVEQLLELARTGRGRLELPRHRVALADRLTIRLRSKTPFRPHPIKVPGTTTIPELSVTIRTSITATPRSRRNTTQRRIHPHTQILTELFAASALRPPLFVRTRKPGDRMTPFGGTRRKLKDILIDDRVPSSERDRLPLLCDQEGILWAIGSRRSERGRVTTQTKKILTVTVSR